MAEPDDEVLEGVFAIHKPTLVSSADVLMKLQSTFASSQTFLPLLKHQPKRPSKDASQVFRIGHGGTLDPLAAGVLIVGVGRGTKHLQQYLACTKSYETVVLFGASTDTYDYTGTITERVAFEHVDRSLVEENLKHFRGTIWQAPPVYSALKVNGIKACEYARKGEGLPLELESREMHVEECELLEWYKPGEHTISWPGEKALVARSAARIRLTVSSGFYVRSFAHDLGITCGTRSCMASLVRTRQANFAITEHLRSEMLTPTITYADLEAGERVWGNKLRPQLKSWVSLWSPGSEHVNGRTEMTKARLAAQKASRPRQRFRGGWVAETKKARVQQQGGKFKGKWNRDDSRPRGVANSTVSNNDTSTNTIVVS